MIHLNAKWMLLRGFVNSRKQTLTKYDCIIEPTKTKQAEFLLAEFLLSEKAANVVITRRILMLLMAESLHHLWVQKILSRMDYTPRKFNGSPLKNGGWKTTFLLGR